MVDQGTRWIQVMFFYLFLIIIVPMIVMPSKSMFSMESMRMQMAHLIVCGVLYYFLGAWYVVNGDYKEYSLDKNNKFVDLESLIS